MIKIKTKIKINKIRREKNMSKPVWMEEEEVRAEDQSNQSSTTNPSAPRLIRREYEPERKQKAFYIQPKYAEAFEDFVIKQRRAKTGRKATVLAEEMIRDLLAKYGEDVTSL